MAFQIKASYVAYCVDVTLRRSGLPPECSHLQLVKLILVKQVVRMVRQWLKSIIMKSNLIGSIALCGCYMNLLGASPLQLSH